MMNEMGFRRRYFGFTCSVLPQFRFPIWAIWKNPSALFWIKDFHLPAFAAHLEEQGIHNNSFDAYYLLFVHWPQGWPQYWNLVRGNRDLQMEPKYGFKDMPAEVAESLHKGEMRTLQEICGWRQIRYHDGTHVPCYGLGLDGSEWHFDEHGRTIEFEDKGSA